MKKVRLTVIIVNWNTKLLLKDCLRSLMISPTNNHQSLSTEVIVVDNGSTDGSAEEIKNLKLKIILNKENLGFAKANNQGIREATGDLILLLNSDTIVKKGALEKLALQLIKSKNTGAISPLLLLPDGRPQTEYFMRFPNLWQIFFYHHPVLRPLVMRTPLKWLIINPSQKKFPFVVDQLPGAALMAKKEVWKKVGFFDEDYHFLFEDVDWCYRAKKAGFRLMVVPRVQIVHFGGASWRQKLNESSHQFYHQFFASLLLFVGKNYGRLQSEIFRFSLVLNFFLTFKWQLAFIFLKGSVSQKKLWL